MGKVSMKIKSYCCFSLGINIYIMFITFFLRSYLCQTDRQTDTIVQIQISGWVGIIWDTNCKIKTLLNKTCVLEIFFCFNRNASRYHECALCAYFFIIKYSICHHVKNIHTAEVTCNVLPVLTRTRKPSMSLHIQPSF